MNPTDYRPIFGDPLKGIGLASHGKTGVLDGPLKGVGYKPVSWKTSTDKPHIVAFAGLIGSGKNAAADFLVSRYGFTSMSFAAPLKDLVASIFGWERELVEGATEESRVWREQEDGWWTDKLDLGIPITPRWVLQNIGTEVFRNHFHPDIWVLSLQRWLSQNPRAVITDARFDNEFQMLSNLNATIIGIHRPSKYPKWVPRFYSLLSTAVEVYGVHDGQSVLEEARVIMKHDFKLMGLQAPVHESEWQHLVWNGYAAVIANDGSLRDLHQKVTDIVFSKCGLTEDK